ncbi:hypothetical protein E3P92_02520 [Wallemia ichthyophaga]|uniref:Uncharacterized protein n=2 Tax=Wallemia ichthyophaga TaxID=245174 RepID=A0A4T0GDA3_WALIC|nr:uncharacterized protein J056_000747 [Wallemia ichthyophaga EXF-994]TIA71524.1 hypothetical protein E3P91_02536 [Wallemia ichthyophaga]EOR00549.1 hypothetical protein J056_000747 [Wallemia ichthyophaga EXF-994]TIA82321.1 hypothetical protein E3P98_01504 [Wallemia ichthyophaga]TIA90465.1 hypothetical protein E3P97_02535 [Wallemia ichthyophaga]TIA99050.1 hypothetical protein E3P95_02242 [Wallemia ichthyophaga]
MSLLITLTRFFKVVIIAFSIAIIVLGAVYTRDVSDWFSHARYASAVAALLAASALNLLTTLIPLTYGGLSVGLNVLLYLFNFLFTFATAIAVAALREGRGGMAYCRDLQPNRMFSHCFDQYLALIVLGFLLAFFDLFLVIIYPIAVMLHNKRVNQSNGFRTRTDSLLPKQQEN